MFPGHVDRLNVYIKKNVYKAITLRKKVFTNMARQQKDITLVLLGAIGCGKSATANTILGKEVFDTCIGQIAVTTKIQNGMVSTLDFNITVVDTPGIDKISDIENYIQKKDAVYALVVRIGRFSLEDREIITQIFEKYIHVMDHVIIIFTHTNDLKTTPDPDTKNIHGWLKKVPTLEAVIESRKIKFVAFENVNSSAPDKQRQVDELGEILRQIEFNKGKPLNTSKRCPVSANNEPTVNFTRKELNFEFGNRGDQVFDEKLQKQGLNSAESSDESGKPKQGKKTRRR